MNKRKFNASSKENPNMSRTYKQPNPDNKAIKDIHRELKALRKGNEALYEAYSMLSRDRQSNSERLTKLEDDLDKAQTERWIMFIAGILGWSSLVYMIVQSWS